MSHRVRAEILARVFLSIAALLPYWPLLTFNTIYLTDDVFTSDIFNGELPGRVLIGTLIRAGQIPLWTNQLCSGTSLTGGVGEPLGLLAFALLSPAAALDLFVITLLLVAAHGAYSLARRFGADRPGAVLAGAAFAGSGVIACQLKHLSIVATVVWLPVGLTLLEGALAPSRAPTPSPDSSHARARCAPTLPRRILFLGLFGLVFAEQVLSGFPQSVYICGLAYGAFAVFWAAANRERWGAVPLSLVLLGGLAVVTAIGVAAGAVVLLPLSELGSVSDRTQGLGWNWAATWSYWPRNALTFLVPYINGDISDNSYRGPSLFWEDYGYVGAATFLLAVYAAVRERRQPLVIFLTGLTLVAFLIVLGPATPVFHVLFATLPGMQLFRLPTRFLIVVELGLALLGGIGLTRLGTDLRRRLNTAPDLARALVLALCLGTVADLFVHQPRQNAMVQAPDWLAPPRSIAVIRDGTVQPRAFTALHRDLHIATFGMAHGWSNLAPYYQFRELLQPNTGGGFWGVPSADCYAGIAPRWFVDVWGDHNRAGMLLSQLMQRDPGGSFLQTRPALANVLKTFGVTHLLSGLPLDGTDLPLVAQQGWAYIYRMEDASRVRFVRAARVAQSEEAAARRLLDPSFDPDREVLLHDVAEPVGPTVDQIEAAPGNAAAARVAITEEDARQISITADVPARGFLLLADTYYPGWRAEVDHNPVPIYRANLSVRAIQLPAGWHEVRFWYEAPAFFRGLRITLLALSTLALWIAGAGWAACRARRLRVRPAASV